MAKLTELFATDEFATGSYESKKNLFSNWISNDFQQLTAGLGPEDKDKQISQVTNFFNQHNPAPKSDFASDALDSTQASFGTLGQLGVELVRNTKRAVPNVAEMFDATIGKAAGMEPMAVDINPALDEVSDYFGEFTKEQLDEHSDYSKDKKLELAQKLEGITGDLDRSKIFLNFMANNPSQLGLMTLESFAPTVAGLIPTIRAAKIGGMASGLVAGAGADFLLGGAEGALGARQTIKQELLASGVREDVAMAIANDESGKAFLPSATVSAVVSPLSDALPAARAFGKKAVGKVTGETGRRKLGSGAGKIVETAKQADSRKLKLAKTLGTAATGIVGEGLQGAGVQIEQNRAVNDLVPTDLFAGSIEAGTQEAAAAGPTIGATQAFGAVVNKLEKTPSIEEILDAGDGLVNQDPEGQDTEIFQDATDEGRANRPNSTTTLEGEEDPSSVIRRPNRRRPTKAQGSNPNDAGQIPNTEQSTSTGTPNPQTPEGKDGTDGTQATQQQQPNPTVAKPDERDGGVADNKDAKLTPSDTPAGSDSASKALANEWSELANDIDKVADVQYADLSPELQKIFKEAVEDNYASGALTEQITTTHKNNLRKQKTATVKDPNIDAVEVVAIDPVIPEGQVREGRDKEYGVDVKVKKNKTGGYTISESGVDGKGTGKTTNVEQGSIGVYSGKQVLNQEGQFVSPSIIRVNQSPTSDTSNTTYSADTETKQALVELAAETEYSRSTGDMNKVDELEQAMAAVVTDKSSPEEIRAKTKEIVDKASVPQRPTEDNLDEKIPDLQASGTSTPLDAVENPDANDLEIRMFLNPISTQTQAKIKATKKIDGALMDALIEEAKAQGSDFFVKIFKALKPHLNGVNLDVQGLGRGYGGYYNRVTDSIVYNHTKDGMNLHTIAHEMKHAATVHAIAGGSSRVNRVADELWKDMQHAISVFPVDTYAFTNIYEFVAEIYTNQDFRAELNKIIHKDDLTLWDKIKDNTFGIFNIQPIYSPDGTIELTELLFASSRELQNMNVAPIGQRGATNWNDVFNDQNSNDVLEPLSSRRLRSHWAFKARMELRNALVDNTARFLGFLNLKTNITRGLAEFDEAPVYMALKSIVSKSQNVSSKFRINQIREIEQLSKRLYEDFSASGLSHRAIRDLAAQYATVNHIPAATDAMFKRFTNALDKVTEQLNEIKQTLSDAAYDRAIERDNEPSVEEEELLILRAKLEIEQALIQVDIKEFIFAQENNGQGLNEMGHPAWMINEKGIKVPAPTRLRAAIQGGMTKPNALIMKKKLSAKLSGDKTKAVGTPQSIQRLDQVAEAYIEAYAGIREYLYENGEIFDSELQEWEELGLTEDFISFQGLDRESRDTNEGSAFGASRLSDHAGFRRRGRTSAPDNAWVNLNRSLESATRRVASREFRSRLLGHIQNGDMGDVGQWTTGSHNATFKKKTPDGYRAITLKQASVTGDGTVEEKTYEFWIEDTQVMEAIRGVSEAKQGFIGRNFGRLTHTWSSALTYLVAAFGPLNSFKDVVELTTNVLSRDIRDTSGNRVNGKTLAAKVARNYASVSLFEESGRIYGSRFFGKKPIGEQTSQTRLGKAMIELENLGGLSNVFEQAAREFNGAQADDKITIFFDNQFKSVVKATDNLTPRQMKKALAAAGYNASNYKDNLMHGIRLWNVMWEVRSKVAMYQALVDMGVDKQKAAFRVRDLMDLSQRGTITKQMSAMFPFFRAILAGSANLQRTMMTPKGWMLMTGASMFYVGIHAALRWAAGDNEEDPELKYNCMDGLSHMSMRTSIPIFIREDGEKGCGRPVKAPVPYGLHYVANTVATMSIRNFGDNAVKSKQDNLLEILHAYGEETFPSKAAIGAMKDSGTATNFFINQFVPPWALGIVNNVTNTNQFGNPIDTAFKPDSTTARVKTEETYKKWAVRLNSMTGGFVNTSPQKLKVFVESVSPGLYESIRLGTINEGGLKGKPEKFKEDAGFFNIVGLSRLYGEEQKPEQRLFFQKINQFTDERKKLGVLQISVRKYNKNRSRSKGNKAFKKKWNWTPAMEAEAPGLRERSDLADEYLKKRKKISGRANNLYKEVLVEQRKKRRLNGDPDINYIDEVGMLRRPDIAEKFFNLYLDENKLAREFVIKINKMDADDANN